MLTRNQAQAERAKSLASQPGGIGAGHPRPHDFDAVGHGQDLGDGIVLRTPPHWRPEDDGGLPVSPPPAPGGQSGGIGQALFIGGLLFTAAMLVVMR